MGAEKIPAGIGERLPIDLGVVPDVQGINFVHQDVRISCGPSWLHAIILDLLAKRIRPMDPALLTTAAIAHLVGDEGPEDILIPIPPLLSGNFVDDLSQFFLFLRSPFAEGLCVAMFDIIPPSITTVVGSSSYTFGNFLPLLPQSSNPSDHT